MSNQQDSALAEYRYDFSLSKRFSIQNELFSNLTTLAEEYGLFLEFSNLLRNSEWSDLKSKLIELRNYETQRPDKSQNSVNRLQLIQKALNEVSHHGPTAFIELDPEFDKISSRALLDLLTWSNKHRYIYTLDFGVVDDLEEYFLRSHNYFNGNSWNLIIKPQEVQMPTGEILYTYNPSKEESVILETALFDTDSELTFASVVMLIKSIDPSKLKALSDLTATFTYDAWVLDPLDFTKSIVELQKHSEHELQTLTQALEVLSKEWDSHGEELIKTATKLILK